MQGELFETELRKKAGFAPEFVKSSKKAALKKIEELLSVDDVDAQFEHITGAYHSSDKFIVTWNENYKGIPSEFSIDKCDAFYCAYSGHKAIYATRSLFHEKQLKAYPTIEMALIDVGLKLCGKAYQQEFFDKYGAKYNARIKAQKGADLVDGGNPPAK